MRRNFFQQTLTSFAATCHLSAELENSVLLTFDDGPSPGITERVVQRLDRVDARAVFFMVGNRVEIYPEVLSHVVSAGQFIGNHSFNHPNSRWPGFSSFLNDMKKCRDLLTDLTGHYPRFYRAPYGYLHPASLLCPTMLGMKHMLWSLDSNDWQCRDATAARETAVMILKNVKSGDIILLHEYADWTLDLLDELLPGLVDRGFNLAPDLI